MKEVAMAVKRQDRSVYLRIIGTECGTMPFESNDRELLDAAHWLMENDIKFSVEFMGKMVYARAEDFKESMEVIGNSIFRDETPETFHAGISRMISNACFIFRSRHKGMKIPKCVNHIALRGV